MHLFYNVLACCLLSVDGFAFCEHLDFVELSHFFARDLAFVVSFVVPLSLRLQNLGEA